MEKGGRVARRCSAFGSILRRALQVLVFCGCGESHDQKDRGRTGSSRACMSTGPNQVLLFSPSVRDYFTRAMIVADGVQVAFHDGAGCSQRQARVPSGKQT